MNKELCIGYIKDLGQVKVKIELKDKFIKTGFDIDLNPLKEVNLPVLSITGTFRRSCGQIYDDLPIDINDWQECYLTQNELDTFIDIWKTYHLNDLNAGTNLQQDIIKWFYNDEYDYNKIISLLKNHCIYNDMNYNYGSQWLYDYLPNYVIEFINTFGDNITKDKSIDERWIWMIENGIKCKSIKNVPHNSHMIGLYDEMDNWLITLINKDNKEFNYYYSTGYGHRMNRIHITKKIIWFKQYDIRINFLSELNVEFNHYKSPPFPHKTFSAVISDIQSIEQYDNWKDWMKNLGYDVDMFDRKKQIESQSAFLLIEQRKIELEEFLNEIDYCWSELYDLFQD